MRNPRSTLIVYAAGAVLVASGWWLWAADEPAGAVSPEQASLNTAVVHVARQIGCSPADLAALGCTGPATRGRTCARAA